MKKILLLLIFAAALSARQPLVVVSVDGLDHRYLRDADKLGLRIPNLRRLMKEGAWADGVVGEVPTITWPEHTTMLTGVPPAVHGIERNQMWDYSLVKVKTLWDALGEAKLVADRGDAEFLFGRARTATLEHRDLQARLGQFARRDAAGPAHADDDNIDLWKFSAHAPAPQDMSAMPTGRAGKRLPSL